MSTPNEKLRGFRVAKGVSQADLAEIAGCDHSRVSRAESGQLDLSTSHIEALMRYYGCAPGDLGYESVQAYRRRQCQ